MESLIPCWRLKTTARCKIWSKYLFPLNYLTVSYQLHALSIPNTMGEGWGRYFQQVYFPLSKSESAVFLLFMLTPYWSFTRCPGHTFCSESNGSDSQSLTLPSLRFFQQGSAKSKLLSLLSHHDLWWWQALVWLCVPQPGVWCFHWTGPRLISFGSNKAASLMRHIIQNRTSPCCWLLKTAPLIASLRLSTVKLLFCPLQWATVLWTATS